MGEKESKEVINKLEESFKLGEAENEVKKVSTDISKDSKPIQQEEEKGAEVTSPKHATDSQKQEIVVKDEEIKSFNESLKSIEPSHISDISSQPIDDSTSKEKAETITKEPVCEPKGSESPDEVKEKSQITSRPEKEESPEERNDSKTPITDLAKQSSSQHDEKSSRIEEEEDKITNFQRGVLKVTVHAASELEKKDFIGKSDPYVKVVFQKEEFKSKTINNTQEPNWDFTFKVDINNPKENAINFEVFDEDFGKDSFEGSYSLSLDRAINESTDGDWFYLEGCKSGKIKISTSFEPHSGDENEVESKASERDIIEDEKKVESDKNRREN